MALFEIKHVSYIKSQRWWVIYLIPEDAKGSCGKETTRESRKIACC